MNTRKELVVKYDRQYKDLHEEFFETVNAGTPRQERRLREDKAGDDLNALYAQITENYDAELKVNGFEELSSSVEPSKDLEAQINEINAKYDELKARVDTLLEGK